MNLSSLFENILSRDAIGLPRKGLSPKKGQKIFSSKIQATKAYEGAWVIAKVIALLVNQPSNQAPIHEFFDIILPTLKEEELLHHLLLAKEFLLKEQSFKDYLKALNLDKEGISGCTNYTVPAVIYAWLYY